jgi:general secretion pathway protein E
MTVASRLPLAATFAAHLAANGIMLREKDLAAAENGAGLLQAAWRSGQGAANDLAALASDYYGLPRGDYEAFAQVELVAQGLSVQFLRENYLLPFRDGDRLGLALADPSADEGLAAIAIALSPLPDAIILSFEEMDLLFERLARANSQAEGAGRPKFEGELVEAQSVEALQDLARGAPIVRAIDQILERAIDLGATDIHFETGREDLRIRMRVDGLLRLDQTLPRQLASAVISRVKILSSLDIAERRLPQDGRANVKIRSSEADLRIAIMPTMYGETAVARILLKDAKLLDFARIGMTVDQRVALEDLLRQPHGVLIVTGPTGSGKTTTLAAAMGVLNDPARKIVTIEDPIEYQIPGVHQTQVKPSIGLTFATALRSFLRHDPDVIMVGEMRDRETASIGIQAALTGHLVLTTLHTNSAADAVIRLADMGIEPFLTAATLRGVLAQRLVRRLCERCRIPDPAQKEVVAALCAHHHLPAPAEQHFMKGLGCPACGQTGFKGRVGLFEIVRVDTAVRALIAAGADSTQILAAARNSGTTTMLEDGLSKAARGLTSIDEVLRAVG